MFEEPETVAKWTDECYWVEALEGLCKEKNSKNPRLLWKWVGGSRSHSGFFFGKSSQNTSKPVQIFWSSIPYVFCDLSVLSMSVMGFHKKKLWMGVGGWGELWSFGIFLTLQSP